MVRANLHLEAVLRLGVWAHHDAGVVQEDVDPLLLGVDLGRALPHRGEAGQIALVDDQVGVGDLRMLNSAYTVGRSLSRDILYRVVHPLCRKVLQIRSWGRVGHYCIYLLPKQTLVTVTKHCERVDE